MHYLEGVFNVLSSVGDELYLGAASRTEGHADDEISLKSGVRNGTHDWALKMSN